MQEYVVELSKYCILGLMAGYTALCYLVYLVRSEKGKAFIFTLQNLLMLGLQFLCFLDLTFVSGKSEFLYLFAFIQVFLFSAVMMVSVIYESCNRLLLNNMCMLIGIGLCLLSRLSFSKAVKQYIIVLASFAICLVIPYIFYKIRFLKKMTWIYALVGIVWLGMVLVMGEITHGSKISFSLAGITFQPSEFVKILFLFYLAAMLWNKKDFWNVVLCSLFAGAMVLILVVSKDLGSALIFFVAYVMVVFLATGNPLYLLAGLGGGSAAAVVAYQLFSHIQVRVLAWQDPWSYIDAEGYQITQSLFAITSGSWFGMGLMQGNPSDIPYVDQDFIFSAVCEEFGVLFGICLILIALSCFVEMLVMSWKITDRFYQLIVYGVAVTYIFQIFLTVGGGIKLIPLTGVTFPFVSYGGSSVMTSSIMFFIVQGVYIRLKEVEKQIEFKREQASIRG